MSFITDQQTLVDLNLLGKHRRGSIYSLFSRVHTAGGERLLDELFRHPLTDADRARLGLPSEPVQHSPSKGPNPHKQPLKTLPPLGKRGMRDDDD